ncbi:MAG: hypothetical protein ACYCSO_10125 [Cuniculiplasma sp.]
MRYKKNPHGVSMHSYPVRNFLRYEASWLLLNNLDMTVRNLRESLYEYVECGSISEPSLKRFMRNLTKSLPVSLKRVGKLPTDHVPLLSDYVIQINDPYLLQQYVNQYYLIIDLDFSERLMTDEKFRKEIEKSDIAISPNLNKILRRMGISDQVT